MRGQWDTVSVVMCWSDVSTAIIYYVDLCIPDMFVNHVALSFSPFITYRSIGSVPVCRRILTRALPSWMINQYQQWSWQLYEYHVLFSDAWLFLVAVKHNRSWWTIMADGGIGIRFRYFSMILFQTIMVFGEWVNLLQFKTRPVGSGT